MCGFKNENCNSFFNQSLFSSESLAKLRSYLAVFVLALFLVACGGDSGGDSGSGSSGDNSGDSGDANAVVLQVTASRTQGVAPLSVFFDLTGSTFPDDTSIIRSTALWDFNDPSSGEQNQANGFVAGHVFNEPGTYNVSLQFYDPDGNRQDESLTIEVTEFSGNTYYVANNGSNDNPGTIDAPLESLEFAIDTYAQQNNRILFRRGDTFELFTIAINRDGPVILKSYSDPNAPSDVKPVIYSTADDSTGWYFFNLEVDDWRIMDLHFRAAGPDTELPAPRYPGAISINSFSHHVLLQDLEISNVHTGVGLSGYYHTLHNSRMHTLGRTGVWSSYYNEEERNHNEGHSFIGNSVSDFDSDHREHVVRLQGINKAFLAHNDFRADDTKTNVQVRGDSQYVVLFRNVLDRTTGFQPQNNAREEYVHHCLADSNLFVARDYSYVADNNHPDVSYAVEVAGDQIMFRNNIIYGYGTGFILEKHPIVGHSEDIYLYNNTVIGNRQNSSFVRTNYGNTGLVMRNNAFYNQTTEPDDYGDCFFKAVTEDGEPNTVETDVDSDFNFMFGDNWEAAEIHTPFRYQSPWSTLGVWQDASGNDLNSRIVLPEINTDIDLNDPQTSLQNGFASPSYSNSPVIDAGADFTVTDFFGDIRNDSAIDVGAIEY